jgi:hypothetical protein
VVILAVLAIGAQHLWQLRRIVDEIAERDERDERRADLIHRAIAAPPSIKRGILAAAQTSGDIERQKRLIVAAKEIGLIELPAQFCRRVESFDTEIQSFGLDQCLEMFRHRSRDFTPAQTSATFAGATRALVRGRLATEPLKKLLRLMTSIVVIKRGVVEASAGERSKIEAALKNELNKPRAKDDVSLRGFLRDLQSALNGSQAGGRLMNVQQGRAPEPIAARRPETAPHAGRDQAARSGLPVPVTARPTREAEPEPQREMPLVELTLADLMPDPVVEDPAVQPDSPSPTVH